ncbi:MAG: gephyrin-like molybdotransferase Glp [Candidatus Velthaea sp.]
MPELFTVVPPSEAFAALLRRCSPVQRVETVPLQAALGRVCADAIVADETLPAFPRATMDGYAVRAADTFGASDAAPAYLRLAGEALMGTVPGALEGAQSAMRIHTGAMLPRGADAVLMVEETNLHGMEVEVLRGAAVGENVLVIGEDVLAGAPAVAAGVRLRAADLGGLAAIGCTDVHVVARPCVAVLSTGDEVVPVQARPRLAQVRDVNATTIGATIERAGGSAHHAGIVPDDEELLFAAARAALAAADALVLSAGSSVSMRDLTARVVDRLGPPGVFVHGIAIKPGKPTVLAVCDGKPVIGLPGNPASALVLAWRIVRPLVRYLGGEQVDDDGGDDACGCDAELTANVPSRPGREDYIPATLERGPDKVLRATPLFGSSNLIFTLVRAGGAIVVPADRSGLAAGERARIVQF